MSQREDGIKRGGKEVLFRTKPNRDAKFHDTSLSTPIPSNKWKEKVLLGKLKVLNIFYVFFRI